MIRHHAYRLSTSVLLLAFIAGSSHAATTINADVRFSHRLTPNPWQLPSKGIEVEFWELDDVTSNDYIGTTTTDGTGRATLTTDMTDGLLDNFLEVYAYASAKIPGVAYVRDNASATPYWFRMPSASGSYSSIGIGTNGNIGTGSVDNTSYTGGAFNILAPIQFANEYFTNTFGLTISEVPVRYYDNPADDRGNYYVGGAGRFIRIDKGDWGSWDVIGHEYAHHIAATHGMDASTGGPHSIRADIIPNAATPAQKLSATALAWNEGLVTAMYQMAVQEGNIRAAFNNNLGSRDYDTWYTDFDALGSTAGTDQVNFEYDLETISFHSWQVDPADGVRKLRQWYTPTQCRGQGEGNELAVQRALWDIYDGTGEAHTGNAFTGYRRAGRSDKIAFGADATWKKAMQGTDGTPNKYFHESWQDITAYLATNAGKAAAGLANTATKAQAVARAGEILEEYNISAMPTFGNPDITNPVEVPTDQPTLTWDEQANGRTDIYRLLVFKSDWSLQYDSRNIADATADVIDLANSHTIPAASKLPNGVYYWVVLSNPDVLTAANLRDNVLGGVANQADWYSYYWSGANAFLVNMVPTPGSFVLIGLSALAIIRRRRMA
ncbi:MAG: hypothetical protein JNK58_04760 [Phycisphaerae bacterium]|nr:hypothetical protein [Phycisphaerae bacterium]